MLKESIIPKLSVIIPVFNVENHLRKCLNSILCQEFLDYEIILVNDGSSDRSVEICKEFSIVDKRIKYFYQENGGVSKARNLGLSKAIGEWVFFMDSDDVLEVHAFDFLKVELNCDLDIIKGGFNRVNGGSLEVNRLNKNCIYSDLKEYHLNCNIKVYTLWIHFFRRSLINKNSILFSENIRYGEDIEFTLKCFLLARCISTSDVIVYNYFIHSNSAMSKAFTIENAVMHLKIVNNLISFCMDNNIVVGSLLKEQIIILIKTFFIYLHECKEFNYKNVQEKYNKTYDDYSSYFERDLVCIMARFNIKYVLHLLKFRNKVYSMINKL